MAIAQTVIPELVESKHMVGLFKADYIVGEIKPGARICNLSLMVNTPSQTVRGIASVTQAVHPPLKLDFNIDGNYTYMTVMPKNVHILVVLKGHKVIKWPEQGGVGPFIPEDFEMRMVLTEDWKSGVANYWYVDQEGKRQEVINAPVTQAK